MTTRKEQERNLIELRRDKILELLAQGYISQVQISQKVHVSTATVCRDLAYLKSQAQDSLKTHLQETIPFEYAKSKFGLNLILQKVWAIADNSTRTDEKLRAYALISECYKHLQDMSTDSTIVSRAMKTVESLVNRTERRRPTAAGIRTKSEIRTITGARRK